MGLRSKYAITLYEILEGYVNRREPVATVAIDEFQRWLKVPENAYRDWRELKKRVIQPAVDEINRDAEAAGFSVSYEGLREGKAFTKIKFTVEKTEVREASDAMLGRKAKIHKRRTKAVAGLPDPDNPPQPSGVAIDTFRDRWPGNDPYEAIGPAEASGTAPATAEPFGRAIVVPKLVADAGDKAARRYANFFASIDNDNTRAAYGRACMSFFAWCETKGIVDLVDVEPFHVGAYLKAIGATHEKPTVKQHLAAIRMLFDWLVVGQVIAINPAHAVRGPKHAVKRGKTPVLTPAEARKLLDAIDVSNIVGLRDRALIGLMAYSFARVSAAVGMRVEDYYGQGKRWWVRLHEKGGKRHEMPCHHNLEAYLDAYLEAAGTGEAKKTPLFRSARGRTGELTENPMDRVDVYRMIRRRARDAGLDADVCCHTFRATGITAFLENGGTLENAQAMAAHESPRTTKLYDRTGDEITLDEVERIAI